MIPQQILSVVTDCRWQSGLRRFPFVRAARSVVRNTRYRPVLDRRKLHGANPGATQEVPVPNFGVRIPDGLNIGRLPLSYLGVVISVDAEVHPPLSLRHGVNRQSAQPPDGPTG